MKMKSIMNILAKVSLFVFIIGFAACENDDSKYDSTPIQVTQIYLEDYKSNVPDRPVDFARLGQMIRIEGSGFLGMKKVYINGFDTYFNLTYLTDKSMLISVSTKTPVIDAEESLRNTIRFVKTGTELSLPFVIRAAMPVVTSMNNTLPKSGETVVVYGKNLHETVLLTLPGDIEVTEVESDEEGEWYSFVMPSGVTESGSIYSEGANGMAATPAYFNFTDCMILDFDGRGAQGFWSWSETGSMINDEDLATDPLSSGRGKCVQLIPERILSGANGGVLAGKPRATECWTAGGDTSDDWTYMYDFIPEDTPLDEVAFQFDIYVPDAWSTTGQIQVNLFNNFNFSGIGTDDDGQRTAFYVPYIQSGALESFTTEGAWQTVTIPFSEFGFYANQLADEEATPPTFMNVVNDRLAATYQNFGMGIVNTDFTYLGVTVTASLMHQKIYTDNWRVVPYAEIEISDFDDEADE